MILILPINWDSKTIFEQFGQDPQVQPEERTRGEGGGAGATMF